MTERLTISVDEAARRLGVSRATAYNAARRGDLPVLRFGGRLLVPVQALDRMLEAAMRNLDADAGGVLTR